MSEEVLKCCFDLLGITVIKKNFKSRADGLVKRENGCWRMGIRAGMPQDKTVMVMLHELAHMYLHYDKGSILTLRNTDYEEQADRAAKMAFDLMQIIFKLGDELEG